MRNHLPYYSAKDWDSIFSKTQEIEKEDWSYVEWKRRQDADLNGIGIFLQDSPHSEASCRVEDVEEFCRGTRLEDLIEGFGKASQRRKAWLDDRSGPGLTRSGRFREYPDTISATDLYRFLRVQV